jgi:NAD(P)-dependent dehydrogenase (short-subunit alcohol dehydrogenase family)
VRTRGNPTSNPAHPLEAQIAVVTGGGRGIGAAIALGLARLGAAVIVSGRTPGPLDQTVRSITQSGLHAEAVPCDVASWDEVQTLAEHVKTKYARLDILVNNAGIGGFSSPLHQLPIADWDRILNTNLRGVFYTIRALAPIMIPARSGHIVNISSLAGKNPLPNGAAYAASKWGLNGLTYSVAEELRAHNIRVSVISPGSTNTELSPHEGKNPSRMLQPEDVAHAVTMIVTQSPQSFASEILLRPTMKP